MEIHGPLFLPGGKGIEVFMQLLLVLSFFDSVAAHRYSSMFRFSKYCGLVLAVAHFSATRLKSVIRQPKTK